MWSLTSRRTKRISGFRKFRLLPVKDFFDSIGPFRKCRDVRLESEMSAKADVRRNSERAQLENSERQRVIIHARRASSAAPPFRYRARDRPERASAVCAAEVQSRSAAISCSISKD